MKKIMYVVMIILCLGMNIEPLLAQNVETKTNADEMIAIANQLVNKIDTSFVATLQISDLKDLETKKLVFNKKHFMFVGVDNTNPPIVYGSGFAAAIFKAMIRGKITITKNAPIGISTKVTIWDEMGNEATLKVDKKDTAYSIKIN